VVVVGETVADPDKEVLPILGEKATDVALLVDQVKVDEDPELIVAGEALKLAVGAGEEVPVTICGNLLVR